MVSQTESPLLLTLVDMLKKEKTCEKSVMHLLPQLTQEELHSHHIIYWASHKNYLSVINYILDHLSSAFEPPKDFLHFPLIIASMKGYTELAHILLNKMKYLPPKALEYASENGHIDIIHLFLPHLNQECLKEMDIVLYKAVKSVQNTKGSFDIIQLLLSSQLTKDSSFFADMAFVSAVENNNLALTDLIMQYPERLTPRILNYALTKACEYQAHDVFSYLLPHCNPTDYHNLALCWASHHHNRSFFEQLFPLSQPQEALLYMQQQNCNQSQPIWDCSYLDAYLCQQKLSNHLLNIPSSSFSQQHKI